MAGISGTAGSVAYGGTAAGTVMGRVTEWSADYSFSTQNTSGMGDLWAEPVPVGSKTFNGSFSMSMDDADTMQALAVTDAVAGTSVLLGLVAKTGQVSQGTAMVTGYSPSTSYEGKAERRFTFESVGAWSIA
jgi:hypothetical protein